MSDAINKMMATPEYDHWINVVAATRTDYSDATGKVFRDGVEHAGALSAMANSSRPQQVEAIIATFRQYEFRAEIDDREALIETRSP